MCMLLPPQEANHWTPSTGRSSTFSRLTPPYRWPPSRTKSGLSAAPCWRRIKRMEDDGVIRRRVALIDRRKANVPMTLFVSVRTTRHVVQWLEDFRRVISDIPEIVEAWRLTGEIDYMLRIVVPDVDAYDAVYKRLISKLEFADISSAIAMEEMKYTTAILTDYLLR